MTTLRTRVQHLERDPLAGEVAPLLVLASAITPVIEREIARAKERGRPVLMLSDLDAAL